MTVLPASAPSERHAMDRGAFVLSLDFELIWGTLDHSDPMQFRRQCEIERTVIVDRLLNLFVEFEIPATWLVVGHLLLDRCYGGPKGKHPDIVRPRHAWCTHDWFAHDPDGLECEAPLFLGQSLIDKIRRCPVPQEIGAHSFSHVIFGDEGCSEATARSELAACVRAASAMGIALRSFAFPRNAVGHLALLPEYGFTCFRGPEPRWYHHTGVPGRLRRLGHLWDVVTASRPPVVVPRRTAEGLVDIPGSMVYFPAHGIRRWVPMAWRVKRALRGLEAAVRLNRIFHLWMHPTNMADSTDAMFGGLRTIIGRAAYLRAKGALDVLPMEGVAKRMNLTAADMYMSSRPSGAE
jgi:peptidoglycan/xylan/chitin deacetylase (PgdA/CDA1 family)